MIIITGASRGLGHAVATRLHNSGYEVLGLARSVNNLPFNAVSCDVSNHEQLKSIAKRVRQEKTLVTGLINAAGIASMNLAITTPPDIVAKIINVNLLGTIYSCQVFAPLMLRSKAGSIINFSTVAVPLALKGESIYVASKAGVEGFSRSFAREMADFNVRVNCIAPGPIDTDLLRGINESMIAKIIQRQIFTRKFEPENVADLVELLIDPKSNSLTGHVINIGGV